MTYGLDKTFKDNNRRDLNFQRAEISNIVPEHFLEQYPNLIELFEAYYDWMDQDNNPNELIQELYRARDVTQVDEDQLQYIEDELLLGQAYFGGFINKREASKFSNILYRSKGTRYSIQQFFRAFYGVDPEVIYPKENIFLVGPQIDRDAAPTNDNGEQVVKNASLVGAESERFLTDDKLYQVLAILIKTDIPISVWREVYKLFVHPAGMYLGGQMQIVSVNEEGFGAQPEIVKSDTLAATSTISTAFEGNFTDQPVADITGLIDSGGVTHRIDLLPFDSDMTLAELDSSYPNILTAMSPSLPVFDDSTGDGGVIRLDTTRPQQTMDQDWYDSIGTY